MNINMYSAVVLMYHRSASLLLSHYSLYLKYLCKWHVCFYSCPTFRIALYTYIYLVCVRFFLERDFYLSIPFENVISLLSFKRNGKKGLSKNGNQLDRQKREREETKLPAYVRNREKHFQNSTWTIPLLI